MVFFWNKKKKQTAPVVQQQPTPAPFNPQTYSFVLSKGFKGFHKMAMEVNMDPIAKKNNDNWKDTDISGQEITFKDISAEEIEVMVNDKRIGLLWDKSSINAVREKTFDKVYAKYDTIHVSDAKKTEERHRFILLVRDKE